MTCNETTRLQQQCRRWCTMLVVLLLVLNLHRFGGSAFEIIRVSETAVATNLASSWRGGATNLRQVRRRAFAPRLGSSSPTIILWMGRGDGKSKKKKKKSNGAAAAPANGAATPAAPRVSNDINIPIKHQIRLAQLYKQQQARHSGSSFRQKNVVRTKYRRTWDDEEIELKAQERRRKGQDPDWDVILSRNASSPLVIVDGYNIIYKWARLKKHMHKGDSQRARQLLVDDLENLASLRGWRIEVVFDGTRKSTVGPLGHGPGSSVSNNAGPGNINGDAPQPSRFDQASKASVSKHGVRVVFTGVGVEADSYIEARCAKAKATATNGELTSSFIVATDDSLIWLAATSAGALCMSADHFVDQLKSLKKAVEYRVEAAMAKVNGHVIRPEKLRGTAIHKFGRGSVVIEDKRNRTKKAEQQLLELEDMNIHLAAEEEEEVPWWAMVPNQTNPYKS